MSALTTRAPASTAPVVYAAARTALDTIRTVVHVLRAVAAGIRMFISFFR